MNKVARVVITKECDRSCPTCANKYWDLDNLPIITGNEAYDVILLTGGEPLKFVEELLLLVQYFRAKSRADIFVYTAKLDKPQDIHDVLKVVDGITITLRTNREIDDFLAIDRVVANLTKRRSCNLSVFGDIEIPPLRGIWKCKQKTWYNYKRLNPHETLLRTPIFFGQES